MNDVKAIEGGVNDFVKTAYKPYYLKAHYIEDSVSKIVH